MEEMNSLNFLRIKARVRYEPENSLHQAELLKLYSLSFGDPPELISRRFVDIGFQTDDPSKDFRGGGLISLQQLVFFATNYPEMYNAINTAEYSFAICSINLTHFLLFYFQLLPRRALGTSDCRKAPPNVMKTFARLNHNDQTTIHEIHAMCAVKMHEKWLEMKKEGNVTVMDFMKALIFSTYYIEKILESNPDNLYSFIQEAGLPIKRRDS